MKTSKELGIALCWLAALLVSPVDPAEQNQHQFCIIGAGPSGLQLGYFFHQANRDYVIVERNNISGSFYTRYPRHRTLISINKRFTGSTNYEFNLRHDWNSLISNNRSLEMRHYSKDYFPSADTYVKYLNDYATAHQLNILYNTNITRIDKDSVFHLTDQNGATYSCNVVIVSTGVFLPSIPAIPGMELADSYDTMSIDPEDYEGQTVLILGRGNSGFETAQNIVGSTAYIHMASRSRVKQAYQTHYVGDLRAINDALVDTYQLKSLDGFLEFDFDSDSAHRVTLVMNKDGQYEFILPDEFLDRDNQIAPVYDRVIVCTGYKYDFSIFGTGTQQMTAHGGKYPAIKPSCESVRTPDLYFAGTSTHSIDYRRSAGGFIHGFRYTARSLFRHLEWRYHQVPWPSVTLAATDVTDHIIKRVNEASGLYQMFGVLADMVLIRDDFTAVYLEDVPIGSIPQGKDLTGHEMSPFLLINFEYGPNYSGPGKDTLAEGRAIGEAEHADESNFLHPVIYYYKDFHKLTWDSASGKLLTASSYHHIVEDFLTNWTARKGHIVPMRRFIESIFKQDLRDFTITSCFELFLTHGWSLPLACKQHYFKGHGVDLASVKTN